MNYTSLLNSVYLFVILYSYSYSILIVYYLVSMSLACMGEGRGVYRVLVGKPEGKRPLGRPRRRWDDNIRMDLQEVGLGYEDWIGRLRIGTGGGRL